MGLFKKITYTALTGFLIFSFLFCGVGFTAYAAPTRGTDYELSTPYEDLNGSTINGKAFNEADFQGSDIEHLQLLNFAEYGFYAETKEYYNLYFYIYNPQKIDLDLTSPLNQIEFRAGGESSASYSKYNIKLLSESGLIYKYKVELTAAERSSILAKLSAESRVYEVSGVELLTKGELNAVDYSVATKYTYTGSGETLNCENEASLAITLDVNAANFRPKGSNGNSNSTYDTLHSVYFSIPNKILADYGDMTAAHARWLNAKTVPMLVVGEEVWNDPYASVSGIEYESGTSWYDIFYENAMSYYGDEEGVPYLLFSNLNFFAADIKNISTVSGDYVFNQNLYLNDGWCSTSLEEVRLGRLNSLPIVFQGTGDVTDASNTGSVISTQEQLNYFKRYTSDACDGIGYVADKYSEHLFETYDKDFTEINIKADETFSLTSQMIGRHWWDGLFGLDGEYVAEQANFEGKAIYAVSDTDFKSTTAATCENLLIGEWDFENFKTFYDNAKTNDETVFLFRYYQSEYFSQSATILNRKGSTIYGTYYLDRVYTNAYLAQQQVQLDFDIIDLTFSKGLVNTVIGVIASPIDNFSPITPPSNYYDNNFWLVGLIMIAILIVFWIVERIITKKAPNDEPNGDTVNIYYYDTGGGSQSERQRQNYNKTSGKHRRKGD